MKLIWNWRIATRMFLKMTDGHHMRHGFMTRGQKLDYEFDEFVQANLTSIKVQDTVVKLKAKGIDRWGAKPLGSLR